MLPVTWIALLLMLLPNLFLLPPDLQQRKRKKSKQNPRRAPAAEEATRAQKMPGAQVEVGGLQGRGVSSLVGPGRRQQNHDMCCKITFACCLLVAVGVGQTNRCGLVVTLKKGRENENLV
jgi:hypothetical protein